MADRILEKQVAITGIGQSPAARPSSVSALAFTAQACLQAISDAGLTRDDIDGLATYPGLRLGGNGYAPVGFNDVKAALGLKPDWYTENTRGPGQLTCIFDAIAAIVAGFARHVLVFRTMNEATVRAQSRTANAVQAGSGRVYGEHQWMLPYNVPSGTPWFALYAQRHFHDYGTTPEQLGQIAVNQRRNAALNPEAIYRSPITIDDYLNGRMISSPLRIYDCDTPIDGSTAFILSRREEARDMPHPVIAVEAIGSALHRRDTWFRPEDLSSMAAVDAAAMMWNRTDLRPGDVDVAQLYDGFSIHTLLWIEAMGFCGRGESGAFVAGGERIALDGELPLNTGGGQLSHGRYHGFGQVHEACLQLRGAGGARQVADDPRVAAIGVGAGGFVGSMLLMRE